MSREKPRNTVMWFAMIWLALVAGILAVSQFSTLLTLPGQHAGYLWMTLGASVLAFAMYFVDKRAAGLNQRRIPEKTLHTVEAIGGWPGALLGQQIFRHKTQKVKFKVVLWMIIALHIAAVIFVLYRAVFPES